MRTVTELIEEYGMLPRGSRVLCAVSGGADSVCLLSWLRENRDSLGIRLMAAHYEHGIRGDEALRDMRFVQELCREWNIPLVTGHGDVPAYAAEHSIGTEEAARELRYAFLFSTAEENGCDRIATAHNANDNGETVLFNLVRGTGPAGLCGIPPVRGIIVRPLLGTDRAQIEEYLRERGIAHIDDSTNADNEYSRNRLRNEVIPLLRTINPSYETAVRRMCSVLRSDNLYLDSLAISFIDEYYSEGSLPLKKLAALPEPVKTRVIRRLCPKSLSNVHINDIIRLAEGTELAYLDIPGARIRRQKGRMYFTDPPVPKKNSKKVP